MKRLSRENVLTILFVSIIVLSLVTFTYGFFAASVSNKDNQVINLTYGTMALTFADANSGINKTSKFGETVVKQFTLENTGDNTASVRLLWKDLVNSYKLGSSKFSLERGNTATVDFNTEVNSTDIQ